MINLNWKQHGDAWFSHYRAYMFRMRRTPSGWIVSREMEGGEWNPIVGAPTRPEAERKAVEWAVSQ